MGNGFQKLGLPQPVPGQVLGQEHHHVGSQFLWPGLCEEQPIMLDPQARSQLDSTSAQTPPPASSSAPPATCLQSPPAPARLRMRCCCGRLRKRGQLRAASNLCPLRRPGCRVGGGFGGRRNLLSCSRAHIKGPSDGKPERERVRRGRPGNGELLCSSQGGQLVNSHPFTSPCSGWKGCYCVSRSTGEM